MASLAYYASKYKPKCGECGAPMELRQSKHYPAPFWGCTEFPKCRGTHGAHMNGKPLGIPANKETREWRRKAHLAFDPIWQNPEHGVNRREAYRMLAYLSDRRRIHIAESNIEECKIIILNSNLILKLLAEWLKNRAVKFG